MPLTPFFNIPLLAKALDPELLGEHDVACCISVNIIDASTDP